MKETKWQRAERYARDLMERVRRYRHAGDEMTEEHIAKVAFHAGVEAGIRDAKRRYGMSVPTATKLLALAQERAMILNKRSNDRLRSARDDRPAR